MSSVLMDCLFVFVPDGITPHFDDNSCSFVFLSSYHHPLYPTQYAVSVSVSYTVRCSNSTASTQSCPSILLLSLKSLNQRSAKKASISPHPPHPSPTLHLPLQAPSTSFSPTLPTTPPRQQPTTVSTPQTVPITLHQTLLILPSPSLTPSPARAPSTSQTNSQCPS